MVRQKDFITINRTLFREIVVDGVISKVECIIDESAGQGSEVSISARDWLYDALLDQLLASCQALVGLAAKLISWLQYLFIKLRGEAQKI